MGHSKNPKRSQLPQPRRRPLPVTPPARYCPKCERQLKLSPKYHPCYSDIYDCPTCETLLFYAETDEYPGETKGKPRPHASN